VGALVVAGINTAAAIKMADLQADIANKYQAMANENREFYNSFYVPVEKRLVDTVVNTVPYKRVYDEVTIGQMQASIKAKFKGASAKVNRGASRYATGYRVVNIKDTLMAEVTALTQASNMAIREEQDKQRVQDNLRWERRANTLKMGRDLQAQVVSYGQLANGVFGDLGRQAVQGVTGALNWLGFLEPTVNYTPQNKQIMNRMGY
jgi:hypothetical protein